MVKSCSTAIAALPASGFFLDACERKTKYWVLGMGRLGLREARFFISPWDNRFCCFVFFLPVGKRGKWEGIGIGIRSRCSSFQALLRMTFFFAFHACFHVETVRNRAIISCSREMEGNHCLIFLVLLVIASSHFIFFDAKVEILFIIAMCLWYIQMLRIR